MVCTARSANYVGLIYDCPSLQVSRSCPFTDLRKKGFSQGIRDFLELDPEKQLKLIEHHRRCILEKETF
jgi:hypothetical protein